MNEQIKLAFASGTDELNRSLIERMQAIYPELPLWVISDFPPEDKGVKWLPWHNNRRFSENLAKMRAAVRGKSVRLAGVMLAPNLPFLQMRLVALALSPCAFIGFNENLDNFMLRPRSVPAILRHAFWRLGNYMRAKPPGKASDSVSIPAPEPPRAFAGKGPSGKPRIVVASPYLPFPLSHGGAVRIYNLMRRGAAEFDQILVAFTDDAAPPPPELLDICVEVVLVKRTGSHEYASAGRPETVEEFDSPAYHEALRRVVHQWQPRVAQLEFTQMAQYAEDCAPARTLLVEHDITFDLFEQRLAVADDWETGYQLKLWRKFESQAWKRVTRTITMSEKDRRLVGANGVVIPNGVDLDRFQPAGADPEPRRLLFIGSFAHLPNLMALEFFLKEVWPLLKGATLHIISGSRPEYFLDFYRDRVTLDLTQPGLEVEGFVSDVRPAYIRAAVVVAPLIASAGTNIKVLEAMAMGKVVVSTPAGVNGLDLSPGKDFVLAGTAAAMAAAITWLLDHPDDRRDIEINARETVEREFGWDPIARKQAELYRELAASC